MTLTFFGYTGFSDSIDCVFIRWYDKGAIGMSLKDTTYRVPTSSISMLFELVKDKSLQLVSKDTDEDMSVDSVFKLMIIGS